MAKKLAFDKVLFTVVLLILGWGLVMVYSASAVNSGPEGSSWQPFLKQTMAAGLGLVAMWAAMHIDYTILAKPWIVYSVLGVTVALLVLALRSPALNDAHRWIFVGPVSIQPSEIAKIALVVFLAYQVDRKWEHVNGPSLLIPAGIFTVLLVALILLQPDFGTASLVLATASLMLFLSGIAWHYIAFAGLMSLPAFWILVVRVPYRWERVKTYFASDSDPLDSGYQVAQSLIAVGSGGTLGVGLGQSVQKLHFLPYAESDFIYSIVAEEFGLVGSVAVLLLFAVLLWRGIRAGVKAKDTFGRFLAWGLSGMIVVQALINVGVVLALLPTTGSTLPLMSYGGSSLVTTLTACGLILNVSQHG